MTSAENQELTIELNFAFLSSAFSRSSLSRTKLIWNTFQSFIVGYLILPSSQSFLVSLTVRDAAFNYINENRIRSVEGELV